MHRVVALMPDVPQFKFPFQLNGAGSPVEIEQDGDTEILDCVEVVLRTLPGTRIDLPDFGTEEQAFLEGGSDPAQILSSIRAWEPRALVHLEVDDVIDYTQHVRLNYQRGDTGA